MKNKSKNNNRSDKEGTTNQKSSTVNKNNIKVVM